MATKLFVNHKCPICDIDVDAVTDHELKKNPTDYNVEFICTRIGRKQYFHTNCWRKMIEQQKLNQGAVQEWKIGF